MTLAQIIADSTRSWGGEDMPENQELPLFIQTGLRSGFRAQLIPIRSTTLSTVTETASHRFFIETDRTARRPTPKGWKRHRGLVLVPIDY